MLSDLVTRPVQTAYARLAIGHGLRRYAEIDGVSPKPVNVDFRNGGMPIDVALARHGGGYRVSYHPDFDRDWAVRFKRYIRATLYWFDHCPPEVAGMTMNSSDGNRESAARFAFSAPPAAHVTIPDEHYLRFRGFVGVRRFSERAPDWSQRSDDIVWRGAVHGSGELTGDPARAADPAVLPRLRLLMTLRNIARTDAGFTRLPGVSAEDAALLRAAGFVAETMAEESWATRRFAIDIDGHTNTWSNLLVRMHLGCCVLKVASEHGFEQWYYPRLRAGEHYVPVKADLSDLSEQIDWARSHDTAARAIAARGQAFARTLDFDSVRAEAVAIIAANWNKPAP